MTFIVSIAALMFLIYWGTEGLDITESHRIQATLWIGGVLGILGTIGRLMVRPAKPGSAPGKTPAIPQGRYTGGFTEDDLTQTDGGRSNMYCRLVIGYADANSAVTSRIIDVLAFTVAATPDGEVVPYLLDAYCEMRRDQRHFRADRIVECHLAEADEGETEVKDLLATLMAAPATTVCDDQTAIVQPVSMPDLVLDYMFRTPTYKRVTVQPVAFGYTERSRGNRRERTLLFIDAVAEGKTKQQRFKTDRIRTVWQAGHEDAETNIASLFLPGQQAD